MKNLDPTTIWIVIASLAVGSFALRFVFIGLVGGRTMPDWLLRHLRYTAAAIIPAMVAPLVVWPSATDGKPDLAHMSAAAAALAVGYITRNVIFGIIGGAATLYGLLYLAG
ncbi:AzlD domain-containing protein [Ruegeria sp. 2205SS24-7]|uniref:AzlD domain-containing protein n=1 Tax=Ruegeria discodermiae TaxID=3064389 RepID=UPI0027420B43|nr:AzlD domain-containing protein [Ruegeria sp. 2205SS24-7]MDP5217490.1 AzlD domain-containing protein [Ruegeria sp. 2205SS24-7]